MSESFITLPYKHERDAPRFEDHDIKYPESLVRYFLKKYTKKGDRVLDPFAGLGTTLFVAEEMGRMPYGIEFDERRHQWAAGQLENWSHLIPGDAAKILLYGLPKMDFSITSPPYMPTHHKWNPLFAGDPKHAGYDTYLKRMALIYKNLAKLMKKNAIVIVQADNLHGRAYTPLVRDLSFAVSKSLRLENEIIVQWKNARENYPHTHCLVFKNI
ncbi:MAG: DNA methyltransferase [Alphaproteobacteria bacterium]